MSRYLVLVTCLLLLSCNGTSEPCLDLETLQIINEYDNRDDADDPPLPPLCDED